MNIKDRIKLYENNIKNNTYKTKLNNTNKLKINKKQSNKVINTEPSNKVINTESQNKKKINKETMDDSEDINFENSIINM